jgi:glycine cleavage system H lipoate-binding protein
VFPWIYEFHWTAGHVIFLGIFFTVVVVVVSTVLIALRRSREAIAGRGHELLIWKTEFEDLPAVVRVCRHQLSGETAERTCHNDFDCRVCDAHQKFLEGHAPALSTAGAAEECSGITLPLDRFYHRGHTWVKPEADGTYTIGLDDFGTKIIGAPDAVRLPEVGSTLMTNGTGWTMRKGKSSLRVLAPVDGSVVEQGSADKGWLVRVRTDGNEKQFRHLLRGEEVRPWAVREVERLQFALSAGGVGLSLADGGEIMPDLSKQSPDVDWEGVWGSFLLQA